ncbi:type II toxin-antitoxin system HicA family toxin [Riemerella anatipestifer]|uniref:Toxin-antitoxin system, toxin component, HicA family n=1 Tax=Riemerella anatipestifer TaxID=34085 RepID=A0A1S7DUB6_RIEAN|nr:type II toxin-antitoxin system HicA family toxin [Riemerella anatipestifer]AQY22687.1 toxin-antitoxin system, toxin component, HicA family [Riemerella anatipestifer]MBT0551158.1 type II toxin-antitoxin system HicA family toxin [Riemerella anatipestifer]MBT0552987.1 type II toxin-antitoxin system HicA family toxin [Riemerella anatipestifer]MCE3025244.1 type II toxin-antitoxin system HicA family toxin [Riemerella anatipestifer]MCU7558691.1 type II toxin-antitoxin system HicA family toxin [Rie
MKYSELHKKLKKAGCYIYRQGKRHPLWYSPITGEIFPTGRHEGQEVAKGTLDDIRKRSGVKL